MILQPKEKIQLEGATGHRGHERTLEGILGVKGLSVGGSRGRGKKEG